MPKSNILGYPIHINIEEDFDIPAEKQAEFIKQLSEFTIREELHYPETFVQAYSDPKKVNIHITWDLFDLNNEIYCIRKHMKELSYQTIHKDFVDGFDRYLMHAHPVFEDENDMNPFRFKRMTWYGKRQENDFDPYVPVLIYRDPRVVPAIDFLNKIKDVRVQDYCLGLLLGYSVADMGRYVGYIG